MRFLAVLLALVCLAEAKPVQLDIRPSISIDPYILGGQDTSPGEFPWQLSQLRGGSHSCGGVLISPTAALTAAHCVDGALASSIDVIAGLYQRSDLSGTQTSAAASFIIHPNYNNGEGSFAHDIAIIYLATAIDTSPSNIEIAILPPDNSYQFTGDTCTLSGWGRTSSSNNLPDTLQKVDIEVISTDDCDSLMIGVIGADCTDNHIAVYDAAQQEGSCNSHESLVLLIQTLVTRTEYDADQHTNSNHNEIANDQYNGSNHHEVANDHHKGSLKLELIRTRTLQLDHDYRLEYGHC